ncbi:MAG TPA: hypothetical protein ENI99_07555 [Sedimenticola sp.]|nr:hypothetical protein [Sedimenticola sp.]
MKKLAAALGLAGLFCLLPPAGMAADYLEEPVSNGGAITGRVTLTGRDRAPRIYKIYKDNQVCGDGAHEFDFVKVVNGALQNVVVYLDDIQAGKPWPADIGQGAIVQKACEFKPFLGVMRRGAGLRVVNDDPIEHNVNAYELANNRMYTEFKVDQPRQGSVIKKLRLKHGGVGMKIECNAHDFMHSYVFVAPNPYFAVVKEDGSFEITDVPPGKYRIRAWHGFLRDLEAEVEVTAGATARVDFQFKGR